MIRTLERLVWILGVLTILVSGATVTLLGATSGVPLSAVDADELTHVWLEKARVERGLERAQPAYTDVPQLPSPDSSAPTPVPRVQRSPSVHIFRADSSREGPSLPGADWVPLVPGVRTYRPRRVSPLLLRRYAVYQDALRDLKRAGSGSFGQDDRGRTVYAIEDLDRRSVVYRTLGLRPGDRILAVNGQPLGRTPEAAARLFRQLKGERRFLVLVERDGTPILLPFFVGS